jgi:outer membrane protein assembly factor BamB
MAQGTFHGDAARTGVYPSAGPALFGGVNWAFNTGGPITGSPAVANGVVYIASFSGKLFAIDQQNGKEKWQFTSRMPIASSPAVVDGAVYIVSSTGALVALDAGTGETRWVFAAESERKFEARNLHGYLSAAQTIPDAWDVFTSSPAVANGRVFFGVGDGNLYAIDADSGVQKWVFKAGQDPAIHNQVGFQSSPAVVDGTVYVGCRDAHVYAIDAATGQKK